MDRRSFLGRTSGLIGVTAMAGCSGNGGNGDTGNGNGNGGEDSGNDDANGGDDTGGDAIKIGVQVPFSGDYAWVGENVMPVAEMVAEQINDAGGINGREISVVQADTEASPDASLSAIQRLIDVEGVVAILGPTSLTYSAVSDNFLENEIPMVSPTAGTTALDTDGGEYIFRTVPSDALGGRAIARAAIDQGYEEMTMLVGNQEVFQSFREPIRSSFEEFGGTVNEVIEFRTGKSSYQSEVQSMMSTDPEITALIGSVEDSVSIMEAAFQANYQGDWFVTQDQTNQEFLGQSENQVTDGIFGLQEAPYSEAQEAGRLDEFRQQIKSYAGWEENRIFATNTYDAMNVVGLALKQTAQNDAEITGTNLATSIPEVANPPEQAVTNYEDGAAAIEDGTDVDYRGLVGPIDFDGNGDVVAPFSIQSAEGGEWSEATRVTPEDL